MIKKEDVFPIGCFSKPHGIKGELSLHTDYAEMFDGVEMPYLVCEMEGLPVPFFIESFRTKRNARVVLVKLERVDDERAAKRFSNKTVYCSPIFIKNYSSGEMGSWNFFIGYFLEDCLRGTLGEVTDVDESTINVLLKVSYQGKELLVPIADELIVSADHVNRRLTVSLAEGLIDL